MRLKAIAATAALFATAVLGAGSAFAQGRPPLAPLLLETKAFEDGGIVPQKYAGRGGVQPGFTISNAPDTTQTFAIIFHDIDVAIGGADDVLHWMAWDIPNVKEIAEGKLPDGSVTGKNITGQAAYMGPGAPPGPRYHHYVFEVYALSSKLDLPDTASRADLIAAMKGKTVAKAGYVGRFKGTAAPAGAGGAMSGPPPGGAMSGPKPGGAMSGPSPR